MHPDLEKILFQQDEIEERVKDLAKAIAHDYKDKRPLLIGILKGCFMFFSGIDPVPEGLEVHFMRASSYVGKTTEANVEVVQLTTIGGQALDVKDRHVIVVEDIVDTGMTMLRTVSHLKKIGGAASVTIATLLDKKAGRSRSRLLSKRSKEEGNDGHEINVMEEEVERNIKYTAFTCPDAFVVGYGLDYDEKLRTLPYIGVMKH